MSAIGEAKNGGRLAYNIIAAKNISKDKEDTPKDSKPADPAPKPYDNKLNYPNNYPSLNNNVPPPPPKNEDRLSFVELAKRSPPSSKALRLPKKGMNCLGMFDYSHYGELKTPINFDITAFTRRTWALSMDCEMVGVGPKNESSLARVSIVNEYGYCLYDKFVKPKVQVTDYRTEFSGIREEDLRDGTCNVLFLLS